MSDVEVLVACMDQIDDSLYATMNLHTDAVLANQGKHYFYQEYHQIDGSLVKLISTADRGVGKKRNKGLMNATGNYLLFADQDIVYKDNYEALVKAAFKKYPKADMIVFNLNYINRFTQVRKKDNKVKRIYFWNCMKYGAPRIAVRRKSVEKTCLSFSTLYGGGAIFSAGEDSLFIRQALKKGLKIYAIPCTIADVKQEESSWFRGYTEKYFIDKGVLLANTFPVLKYILIYYFAFGLRNVTDSYTYRDICGLMRVGIKKYKDM